jgi:uncharacterized repeat protein (TIGR03803 family)
MPIKIRFPYTKTAIVAAMVASVYSGSAGAATETTILVFAGGTMGVPPYFGVIRDRAGNFYGTAESGGAFYAGAPLNDGVVFKVSVAGKETVLHSFSSILMRTADGAHPSGGLTADGKGNLYGTTENGGSSLAWGTVFKISAVGHESVVHSFNGTDGGHPETTLVVDHKGNFYGTTTFGGPNGFGTVFERSPSGGQRNLCSFLFSSTGGNPLGRVAIDASDNVYGIYSIAPNNNYGGVFKVTPAGVVKPLYTFKGGADGDIAVAGVRNGGLIINNGNLYGVTTYGGKTTVSSLGSGVVFRVTKAGKEQVLYRFNGRLDGANPQGALIADTKGNLYGSTTNGGARGLGVIFKLTPTTSPTAPYKYTVLYAFKGARDGGNPSGDLTRDAAGNLYGTTATGGKGYGALFKIIP